LPDAPDDLGRLVPPLGDLDVSRVDPAAEELVELRPAVLQAPLGHPEADGRDGEVRRGHELEGLPDERGLLVRDEDGLPVRVGLAAVPDGGPGDLTPLSRTVG